MKGVLADTGPLYAAYDSSDSYHDKAQQSLIILADKSLPVVLIYPVLLECHNLLLKRFGTAIGLRFLQEMKTGTLIINPDSVDYDRSYYKRGSSDPTFFRFPSGEGLGVGHAKIPPIALKENPLGNPIAPPHIYLAVRVG